ncbi:hypothetical protein LINPERHAP2_LOCUS4047 [Linum perenne]
MSEKVREREGEDLESRAVRGSGFGVSTDRCGRSYQIRNVRISMETSDGRFGSICRLMSTKGLVPHFVFLDRSLVLWLESVLQVASSKGWTFPPSCESASSRRSLAISSFVSSSGKVLKISESCSNGKLFYVLIPSASASEGWKNLLSVCRDWIALALAPPPPCSWTGDNQPMTPLKSFASVVRGSSLSFHGRCVDCSYGGKPGIQVESDGVLDRLSFLESCLVFRFSSHDKNDWPRFRKWASQNWDSPIDAPIHQLGDGLWLMSCGSKSKVDRILSVNRRSFFGTTITLDKWIPGAGCSAVLAKDKVLWITASGIPIHLRSSDLIRHLGTVCGDFLDFEACSSLSSVRIKIRLLGRLPETIPIKFEQVSFEVRITPDSTPADFVFVDPQPPSAEIRKSVLRPISFSCFGNSECFELGSPSTSSKSTVVDASPAISPPPGILFFQSGRRPGTVIQEMSARQFGRQAAQLKSRTLPTIPYATTSCAPLSFVGFRLDDSMGFWSVGVSGQVGITPLLLISSGLGHFGTRFGLSMGSSLGPFSRLRFGPDACSPLENAFIQSKGYEALSSDDSNSQVVESGFCPSFRLALHQVHSFSSGSGKLARVSADDMLSSSPQPTLCSVDSPPSLSSTVGQMAILFGLELDGSRDKGVAAAIASCEDSSSRRPNSNWRRLVFDNG